jgi:hypothetical protein
MEPNRWSRFRQATVTDEDMLAMIEDITETMVAGTICAP